MLQNKDEPLSPSGYDRPCLLPVSDAGVGLLLCVGWVRLTGRYGDLQFELICEISGYLKVIKLIIKICLVLRTLYSLFLVSGQILE